MMLLMSDLISADDIKYLTAEFGIGKVFCDNDIKFLNSGGVDFSSLLWSLKQLQHFSYD